MGIFDVGEQLREMLGDIISSLVQSGMQFAAKYISNPTNLNKIPFLNDLITGSQLLGNLLVALFFYKRVLEAMRNDVTEEETVNWAEIIGSTAISLGLVNVTPFMVKKYLIPISNEVLLWLSKFPINVHIPGNKIIDIFAPGGSIAMVALDILLMLLVWSVGIVALGIASMIRYGQLALLIIAGPIVAASYVNRSEVYKTYWVELVSVTFTQCIHMLMFLLIMSTVVKGSFEYLLMSFGFMVVAITGPAAFKQVLHSSGTKRGMGMAAQFAVYRVMMSGFKKG